MSKNYPGNSLLLSHFTSIIVDQFRLQCLTWNNQLCILNRRSPNIYQLQLTSRPFYKLTSYQVRQAEAQERMVLDQVPDRMGITETHKIEAEVRYVRSTSPKSMKSTAKYRDKIWLVKWCVDWRSKHQDPDNQVYEVRGTSQLLPEPLNICLKLPKKESWKFFQEPMT